MLINTVILFIRDTLPIFMLISFLLVQRQTTVKVILTGTITGLAMAIMLYINLSALSEVADGNGLEWAKGIALIVAFIAFCRYVVAEPVSLFSAWAVLSSITMVNAIHFIIYSVAYWPSQQADMSLMIGTIIGLGISCSVSVLLFFVLESTHSYFIKISMLAVFIGGQVANITVMAEQINLLNEQPRVWDTSTWLADDSEYGHFFNVLVGYEATPGPVYLAVYSFAVIVPLILKLSLRGRQRRKATGRSV